MHNETIEIGRFLISPMTRPGTDGRYIASVSIRSGQGMASIDRIMRFTPSFASPNAALRYAANEGKAWALQH
ncbi:hypothetical protein ACDA63_18110 [Uliginosibacterium sp. sgz301328]|uniref:hypothetical protein n=1 Tax=Uliginosibacterium sp. sgz301328 TaxID=3243764 RepID=UPI00359DB228